jgi:hypothetical protein
MRIPTQKQIHLLGIIPEDNPNPCANTNPDSSMKLCNILSKHAARGNKAHQAPKRAMT